ncbi:MAG: IPExxxVDY family protein [Bacteroidales bacterium]
MAKKTILTLDDAMLSPGDPVILITSTNKDYRMAYFLNKHLDFKLSRCSDMDYASKKGVSAVQYSLYDYEETDIGVHWCLLSNKHERGNLIKRAGDVDFLLIGRGSHDVVDMEKIVKIIRSIPHVLFVREAANAMLSNMEGVMQSLELTLIEEERKKKGKRGLM